MIGRELNLREQTQVYESVDMIMDSITSDPLALAELTSGNSDDIDHIMNVIAQETAQVIIPGRGSPLKGGNFQYLDNLTTAIDDTWKRTSMAYFIQNVLPDFDIEIFHLEWLQMVGNFNKTCNIASRGLGKAVKFGTKVQTPTGEKLIEKIVVGDVVFGQDGKETNVVGVFPQGVTNNYKITFRSGRTVDCCEDHLWEVSGWGGKLRVVDTKTIASDYIKKRKVTDRNKGYELKYRVRNNKCVQYSSKNFDVDPYLIGYLLGDGHVKQHHVGKSKLIEITVAGCDKKSLLDTIALHEDVVYNEYLKKDTDNYNIRFSNGHSYRGEKLFDKLNKLDMCNKYSYQKSIPEEYFYGDESERLLLLSGIMDSDGYVTKMKNGANTIFFTSTSKDLAKDVVRLCRSLGIASSMSDHLKNNCRGYYNVRLYTNNKNIFKLERKRELVAQRHSNYARSRELYDYIVDVKKIDPDYATCITVDNEDHLFLVNDFVVTHNSHFWSFAYILWHLWRYKRSTPLIKQPQSITKSKQSLVFSNEFKLLKIIVKNIKEEIEENSFLRETLYPGSRNADWGKESLKTLTGSSVDIRSYGSSARGLHVYNIVVDDLLNDAVLYNREANEKFISYYYSVIENILEPGGWIRIVGTPFSGRDLYADIKSKKGFAFMEHPIIMPDGSLTYEKKFPMDVVEEKFDSQGSLIFSREMMCMPISSDSSIFPKRMLNMGLDNSFSRMRSLREAIDKLGIDFCVLGCDFAISANVGADASVFTTIGVKGDSIETCKLYLLDVWIGKGVSYLEQMNVMKSLNSRFKYRKICLENNVFQQVFVEGGKAEGLPVFGHNTNTNKYDFSGGVPSIGIWFEQTRIRLPMLDEPSKAMTKVVTDSLGSIAFTDKGLQSTGGGNEDDSVMSLWKTIVAVRECFNDSSAGGEYGFV
tara:strand:- start:6529 stop:9300 length:2772 start_codon:yes stop_codon:yes gene_type:complete